MFKFPVTALTLGLSLATAQAQSVYPPVIPPGSGILPLNNTWLGTNDFTQATTFDAGVTFNGKPNVWTQNFHFTGPVGGLAGQGTAINLYTSPPPNYTGLGGYVQPWSISPTTGALGTDSVRTSNIINFTTLVSPAWFESGLIVNSNLNTGHVNDWVTTTAYNAGDYVFGVAVNIYQTASNCTTANNKPSGTGTTIDGTCTWTYIAPDIFYGKAGASFFTLVSGANAPAAAWGIYNDFTVLNTVPTAANRYGHFWAAEEIAVTNQGHAAVVGTDAMYALLIDGFVTNMGLAAIGMNPQTTGPTNAYHIGILLQDWTALDYTIWDQGHASISLYISGSHASESIYDTSTSAAALHTAGTYSYAFIDTSTTTYGINLAGTYATDQVLGIGWSVNPTGGAAHTTLQLTAIPTSAGGSGLYVCVDSSGNTYKKASCP